MREVEPAHDADALGNRLVQIRIGLQLVANVVPGNGSKKDWHKSGSYETGRFALHLTASALYNLAQSEEVAVEI